MDRKLTFFILMLLRKYFLPNLYTVCLFNCAKHPHNVDLQIAREFPILNAYVFGLNVNRDIIEMDRCTHYLVVATRNKKYDYPITNFFKQFDVATPLIPFTYIMVTDDLENTKITFKYLNENSLNINLLIILMSNDSITLQLYRAAVNIEKEYENTIPVVLLDIWNTETQTFTFNNHLFPLESNGYGTEIVNEQLITVREHSVGAELYMGGNSIFSIIEKEFYIAHNYSYDVKEFKLSKDNQTIEEEDTNVTYSEEDKKQIEDIENKFLKNDDNKNRLNGLIFVDFAQTIWVVPKPRTDPNINLNFIFVFEYRIWMFTILIFVLVRLAFAARDWIYAKLPETYKESPIDSFAIYGLFWGQGLNHPLISLSSRLIYTMALLMLTYFVAMYSSGIVTALVTPKYIKDYQTIEQIEADPDYEFIYEEERPVRIEDMRTLYTNDRKYNYVAIMVMYNNKFVQNFHMNRSKYMIFSNYVNCDFIPYFPPFTICDAMNKFMMHAHGAGLIQKWFDTILYERNKDFIELDYGYQYEVNKNVKLDVHHLLPLIYVWIIALGFAIIFYLFEIVGAEVTGSSYYLF